MDPNKTYTHKELMSIGESCVEIGEQWASEKDGAQAFYDRYANQLGGWPGVITFQVELMIALEEEVLQVGGWGSINKMWDEVITQIVFEAHKSVKVMQTAAEMKEAALKFIHDFIQQEIL